MPHSTWLWMIFDDFVNDFNKYRASNDVSSVLICVEDLVYNWYGLGGHWTNIGLPMYMVIDHKPVNGCEIQK